MSVKKYGDTGRWRALVFSGGRQVASKVFDRKADAIAWETGQNRALVTGDFIDQGKARTPLAKVIADFETARHGTISQKTYDEDCRNVRLRVSPELKRLPVGAIRTHHIEGVLGAMAKRGLAVSTMSRTRDTLYALFAYAQRHGYVPKNPAADAMVPKGQGKQVSEVRPFSAKELSELVAAIRGDGQELFADVTEFLAATGLRWGEMRSLRVKDVMELPMPAVQVARSQSDYYEEKSTKSGRERRVPLRARAVEIAEKYTAGKKQNDLLFPAARGSLINAVYFTRATKWKARSSHTRHQLRHTFACDLLTNGIEVRLVSQWLGHADTSITLKVYAAWVGLESEIAAMEKLRELDEKKQAGAVVTPIKLAREA